MGYSTVKISKARAQALAAGREVIEASEAARLEKIDWRRAALFEEGDNGRLYITYTDGGFSVVQVGAYSPKTGAACGCRPGIERDNCPACEGSGQRIDFAAIRARNGIR